MELSEEYLVAEKQPVLQGEVHFHKEVEDVLQHLPVDAEHDEVYVEHVPINQAVPQRRAPWQEDDSIVVPVYEEQVVVTKRLILKEKLRIRRVKATERRHIAEQVRRERPVFQEFGRQGVIRENYPVERRPEPTSRAEQPSRRKTSGGIFHRIAEAWDRAA